MSATLLIAATALKLGSAAYETAAAYKKANRIDAEAKRAAELARGYAVEDLAFQQAAIKDEAQQLRMSAQAQAHQIDMQEQGIAAQAEQESAEYIMAQAMRGVTGSGIMRSGQRMVEGYGRNQSSINKEREFAFSRYEIGLRSVDRAYAQADSQARRTYTDIAMQLDSTRRGTRDMRKGALTKFAFDAAGAGLSAAMGAQDAGLIGGGGGGGGGAGAMASTAAAPNGSRSPLQQQQVSSNLSPLQSAELLTSRESRLGNRVIRGRSPLQEAEFQNRQPFSPYLSNYNMLKFY